MKYIDDKFGILSIFNDVQCEHYTTLYDNEIMEELWKKINNCEIVNTYRRKLPQLDYNFNFMYVTDIVFKYKNEYYIVYANIICRPFINGKWFRYIDKIKSYIKKLSIYNNKSEHIIKDSDVQYIEEKRTDETRVKRYCKCTDEDFYCNCFDNYFIIDDWHYFINIPDNFDKRCDEGFEELRYYGDEDENQLNGDELTEKYEIWKKNYKENNISFSDDLDLICFLLLLYNEPIISSGK